MLRTKHNVSKLVYQHVVIPHHAPAVIARLQQVHLVVDDIESRAREMKSSYEVSLEPFTESFDKLIGLYPNEFDRYRLDEIVVAAIAPVVGRSL